MQIFSQKTYLDSGQQLLDLKTEILIFHQTLLSITHCLLQNKGDITFTIQMSPSQHKKPCSNFELHWFAAYPGTAALSESEALLMHPGHVLPMPMHPDIVVAVTILRLHFCMTPIITHVNIYTSIFIVDSPIHAGANQEVSSCYIYMLQ